MASTEKETKEQRLERLKNIVSSMPEKPGSYQYYNENHEIIYVGKAKKVAKRNQKITMMNPSQTRLPVEPSAGFHMLK